MTQPILNRVFAGQGTTIFTVMSALATEHGAINLGQGFPDVDGPQPIRARAARALIEDSNQYPPMMGVPVLRQSLARHSERHYGFTYDWQSEILVTSGATEALGDCVMAFINPGDEVILIEPAYDSYRPIIEAVGGVVRTVRLKPPSWELSPSELKAAFTPKTRLLMLNSPMNPVSKVFSAQELEAIAALLRQHNALAICDEVYEHITFDGTKHVSLVSLPGMRERCVRVGSAGKIFSLTGWKVGWISGPANLISVIAKAHQFVTFTTPPALQIAIADALDFEQGYYLGLAQELQEKRDILGEGLTRCGFEVLPCQGTYFITANYWSLAGGQNDVDFCRDLVTRAGIAAIPLSAFYKSDPPTHLIRFAFCKRREVLEEAVARLRQAFRR